MQLSSRMLYPRLNTNRDRMIASAGEHRRIYEAIRDHRAEEAERLSRRHVENAITTWLGDGTLPRPGSATTTDMSMVGD